ncbi:MAG: (2Fe-2S)-binding protein [Myxococcota bacterium]
MHICSCRPADQPLTSGEVVQQVAAGASTMADVIERTGAGTGCGGCAKSLSKAKVAVREIAAERDAAAARGEAWPTRDEFGRADSRVSSAVLGSFRERT